jgi:hypothetical protein
MTEKLRSCLSLCLLLAAAAGCLNGGEPTEPKGRPELSKRQYAEPPRELALANDYLDQTGFVLHWIVLGPFPNPGGRVLWSDPMPPDINEREINFHKDFLASVGGEKGVKPKLGDTLKGEDGKSHAWSPVIAETKNGYADLEKCFRKQGQPTSQVLAYAACFLKSSKAQKVILSTGSDDGYKLWVNGEFVISHHTHRGAVVDDDPVPVFLREGVNLVLLKVATDSGGWGMIVRVVAKGFEPAEGVTALSYPETEVKTGAKP